MPLRVCDYYAHLIHQNRMHDPPPPPFELFWAQPERDAAIAAMVAQLD